MRKYDLHIDGEFQASDGDDTISVTDPYDGEVWAHVPRGTATDVDRAVRAARNAFESEAWGAFTQSRRRTLLNEIADAVADNVEELAELETR
jgi:aldehyde dehydrogenase (NAD+)